MIIPKYIIKLNKIEIIGSFDSGLLRNFHELIKNRTMFNKTNSFFPCIELLSFSFSAIINIYNLKINFSVIKSEAW